MKMRYFRVLTLSIVFHIVLAIILAMIPKPEPIILRQPTVVDLMESPALPRRPHQPPINTKQFVRKTEVPAELQTNEKRETDFASEDEQYVLEQTRARNTGMTKNRSTEGQNNIPGISRKALGSHSNSKRNKLDLRPDSPLDHIEDELAREQDRSGLGDVAVGETRRGRRPEGETDGESRPLIVPNFGGVEHGFSTLGESLPDSIKFGDFTVLNTDRHLYYTFYARMEEAIRNRWVNYARAVLYNYSSGAQRLNGRETWTTRLEVVLDPQGIFKRAILQESSGIKSLDSAPVQAFRDAQQFPHPPAEMVKNGEIHVYYAFAVNVVPAYAAKDDNLE
jgi:TonB family protein